MLNSFATQFSLASRLRQMVLLLSMFSAVLVLCTGCRSTTDNQIDLLERELRVQENYIYELEDYVVEYSEKLRSCRSCPPSQTAAYSIDLEEPELELPPTRTQKSSRRRSSSNNEDSVLRREDSPEAPPEDDLPPPTEPKPDSEISPEDIEVPDEIDLDIDGPIGQTEEGETLQQVAAEALEDEPAAGGALYLPDPVHFESTLRQADEEQIVDELFADDQIEETIAIAEPRVAEKLEVARLFRGEGDVSAPLSLLTVVEALDANGEPVDLEGEVSLMVMTADESKPERLERWDFSAEETTSAWQSTDLGDGLHLELPLEEIKLPSTPLELWVRLVTVDGRKLLTQLPFESTQLDEVTPEQPPSLQSALAKVDEVTGDAPSNTLRIKTASIPRDDKLSLMESQQPAQQPSNGEKTRWRSSMQRTDRTSESFSTTANKNSGWSRQSPGRYPFVPAKVTTLPPIQRSQPTTPANASWSSSRY